MSNTVVMKFGGTSVGTPERIRGVAKRVVEHRRETGDRVVVVVSAMGGETDRLVALCQEVSQGKFPSREYDQLLASGEQVSTALTAMALHAEGVPSKSLLAPQLPLRTKTIYGLHLIEDIEIQKIERLLDEGVIPVIAGFQGIDEEGNITTLGRGGSDTTAVAIAAALGEGCRCMILTDVDGVYTARPQICKGARKLRTVTYEEMLELAGGGAKVLQTRSVSLARKYKVPLEVGFSLEKKEGTRVIQEYEGMENAIVSGITHKSDQVMYNICNIPDVPGVAAKIFRTIAETGVVVDEIVQNQAGGKSAKITFTVSEEDAGATEEALATLIDKEIPGAGLQVDKDIAKVSIVGEGMRTHSGVASQMFEVLASCDINIGMISTSEIKISVLVQADKAEKAVQALHTFFVEDVQ